MTNDPEQTQEVKRLVEAIAAFRDIEDDEACAVAVSRALEDWPSYQTKLRQLRQQRVNALKEQGRTWNEIGQLLGGILRRSCPADRRGPERFAAAQGRPGSARACRRMRTAGRCGDRRPAVVTGGSSLRRSEIHPDEKDSRSIVWPVRAW